MCLKIKSWAFSFFSALLFSRSIVVIVPFLIPECRGGCELHELLGYFLWDFYNPLIVFVVTTSIFVFNLIFTKRYGFIFSSVIGVAAGIGAVVLYPSDGTEMIDQFLTYMNVPDTDLGLLILITVYAVLFGAFFFMMAGIYFLSIRVVTSKYGRYLLSILSKEGLAHHKRITKLTS